MSNMFENALSFNTSFSKWDTSSLTSVESMLKGAMNFNTDLFKMNFSFEVSKESCGHFADPLTFTQNYWPLQLQNYTCGAIPIVTCDGYNIHSTYTWPLIEYGYFEVVDNDSLRLITGDPDEWYRLNRVCTTHVTNMSGILNGSTKFNGDISTWDTSSVTDMYSILRGCNEFDQNIGLWDTSSVEVMAFAFSHAYKFNQDLSTWDVSSVTRAEWMFEDAYKFNSDISGWDVSSVTSMLGMFYAATSFNQNIGHWQVQKVNEMSYMFTDAYSFYQDLSYWKSSIHDWRLCTCFLAQTPMQDHESLRPKLPFDCFNGKCYHPENTTSLFE